MKHSELVEYMRKSKTVVDDQIAVKVSEIYPLWTPDKAVVVGDRLQHDRLLYKCRQDHMTQADWAPDITPALWEVIELEHQGTIDDPIPYSTSMTVYNGKYYIWENVVYKCIRDSGQPLYAEPGALLGNYFETPENQ